MPKIRTPMGVLMQDKMFRKDINDLAQKLCSDVRINARMTGYVNAVAPKGDAEMKKKLRSEVYRDALKAARALTLERLQEDLDYTGQAQRDATVTLLARLFGLVSQKSGQRQAQNELERNRRALGKDAIKDRLAQLEQGGGGYEI